MEPGGVGELHAPSFSKRRIRGLVQRCVAVIRGVSVGLSKRSPSSLLHQGRIEVKVRVSHPSISGGRDP